MKSFYNHFNIKEGLECVCSASILRLSALFLGVPKEVLEVKIRNIRLFEAIVKCLKRTCRIETAELHLPQTRLSPVLYTV